MRVSVMILCQTAVFIGASQINVRLRESRGERKKKEDSKTKDETVKSKEKWLVDSIFYEDYQSDSPGENYDSQDVCPPVPDVITADACANSSCQKDTDCVSGFRCCFTGCSFTCLQEIKPAPVVDWRKEPRRSRSGISWLIGEGKESSPIEACSTSPVEPDEDPLLCPDGYFCHITTKGNPGAGIPNSGYCVKRTDDQYTPGEEELVIKAALKQREHCVVDNIVLLEGANIKLHDKSCRCKKGFLSCKSRSTKDKIRKRRKDKKLNKTLDAKEKNHKT